MSLNFRKGIIYEYEENVRIYNDYFNLVLEKEKVGGPVVVKAIELRRNNRLQGKKPIIYRHETTENYIVELLNNSDIKVATTELYAKKILAHLVFNYKKNELRILTTTELLERRKKMDKEKSNVLESKQNNYQGSTSSLIAGSSTMIVAEESGETHQGAKRKAFLTQLSTIRKYFMEKTKTQYKKTNRNNRNNIGTINIANNVNYLSKKRSNSYVLSEERDETDKMSTTSDDKDNRLLEIHDCGEIVPAHPMWGTPGLRIRKAKNKYLYKHGSAYVDKMIPKKKFSGGFNHKVYVSNIQYPPKKTESSPKILLGNARAGMHGKLYRRWSLKSLKTKEEKEGGKLCLSGNGLRLVPEQKPETATKQK